MTEGSDEQKARYLPESCRATVWCQGFSSRAPAPTSRPSARARARRRRLRRERPEDLVLLRAHRRLRRAARAHRSRRAEAPDQLADPAHGHARHRVRPIDTVLGSSEFCEVFLDDVRVPVANRVGAENDGWRITQVTFALERDGVRERTGRGAPHGGGPRRGSPRPCAPPRARSCGGGARRRLGAHEAQRVAGCAQWLAGRRALMVKLAYSRAARSSATSPSACSTGRARHRQRVRRRTAAHPRAHDRRRDVADPAQHHLGAPPRPPEGAAWTSN